MKNFVLGILLILVATAASAETFWLVADVSPVFGRPVIVVSPSYTVDQCTVTDTVTKVTHERNIVVRVEDEGIKDVLTYHAWFDRKGQLHEITSRLKVGVESGNSDSKGLDLIGKCTLYRHNLPSEVQNIGFTPVFIEDRLVLGVLGMRCER